MKFFGLEHKMQNKWRYILTGTLFLSLTNTFFVELLQADWSFENFKPARIIFLFLVFTLFYFLVSYFSYKSREKHLKEWENK
tara:strand:- start:501 stop:746 length:246 start_codon:yes stop_codon:yes gene_type:complete